MVLRSSNPASTASPNAHSSAQASDTPSKLNGGGCSLLATRSSGERDQVSISVTATANTTSPPVTSASLVTSHRVRGTVWLHASCQVPRSSSCPSKGAPTAAPRNPGIRNVTMFSGSVTGPLNLVTNELIAAGQPAPPLLARHAPSPS